MNGFIKLQRDIQGTWIHKDPVLLKAWIDILFNVNWEEKKVLIGSTQYTCGVGESLNSLDTWARIFGKGWDKSKVRRFFKRLESATLIDTQNERKTTRLKVLVSISYEVERHAKRTQNERKTTPTKELKEKEEKEEKGSREFPDNTSEKVYNKNDRRKNKKLPFDVVSSSETIKATFTDFQKVIHKVKEAYGVEANEQDVKTAMHTFSTEAVARFDRYRSIRDYDALCNNFIDWIPRSIKYQNEIKNKPLKNRNKNKTPETPTTNFSLDSINTYQ